MAFGDGELVSVSLVRILDSLSLFSFGSTALFFFHKLRFLELMLFAYSSRKLQIPPTVRLFRNLLLSEFLLILVDMFFRSELS